MQLLAGCASSPATASTAPDFAAGTATGSIAVPTPTPFQPVAPTATSFRALQNTPTPPPTPAPTAAPTPTPTREPLTGVWHDIDFNDTTRRIELTLRAGGELFNAGKPLTMGFRPGRPCAYLDFRACIGLHESDRVAVILATVHSGMGGDGQPLRHALEGTGFNQAAFRLDEIQNRLEAIQNAKVDLQQGSTSSGRLRVLAAVRVPPDQLDSYFNRPVPDALDDIAQTNPALARALESRSPLLIIETCGWRQPQEAGLPGATDTTGSVYLLVIQ